MPQEQIPKINTQESASTQYKETVNTGVEPKKPLNMKPPLVSEEQMARMYAQIDEEFKDSGDTFEKSNDEPGGVEQGMALTKIASYLLMYTYAMRHPWAGKMLFKDEK